MGRSLRWGLWAGPAYVVAILVGNGLSSAGGSGKTDAAHDLADLQRPQSFANHLGLSLEILGFVALFFFLAAFYRVQRRAEGPDGWLALTAYGAGIAGLAVKVGSAAPLAAALYRKHDIDATTARTLIDINGGAFVVDGLLVAVFVLAAGLSFRVSGMMSGGFVWPAVVVGVVGLVTPIVGIQNMDHYAPIPFLLCLVWILVVGAVLAVRAGRETPAATAGS